MNEKEHASTKFHVENGQDSDVLVVVEPWADEHKLSPGGRFQFSFVGSSDAAVAVELLPGRIVFYGRSGDRLTVSKDENA